MGEIGILSNADTARTGKQCFISINFENSRYCGTLEFTDPTICWSIAKLLKTRVGMSIKDIGDLDI